MKNFQLFFNRFIKSQWKMLLVIILVGIGFYLRIYGWENYSQFGWDQVDNAWAAKNILIDHKMPLTGMVAKGNSGVYIGPLYYYAIAIFYYFTHLDPVASIVFAAVTSLFSCLVIFFVVKKLFSFPVAFIALFIQAVSLSAITFDRVQWPVDFIPAVSLLVLYFLYRVIIGNEKFLIWLGIVLGVSFHIHFTAVFFPILILFSIPFMSRTKKTLLFGLIGLGIFLIFMMPSIITFLQNKSYGSNALRYGTTSYHGIHLRRMLQLANDAFIQFAPYLYFKIFSNLRLILFPLFALFYLLANKTRKAFLLVYLFGLWFLIPWIVLSTYTGELSDYYFASTRFIALIIISYFISYLFSKKYFLLSVSGGILFFLYAYVNLSYYFTHPIDRPLSFHRANVLQSIQQGKIIQFTEGDPDSYLYYLYAKH